MKQKLSLLLILYFSWLSVSSQISFHLYKPKVIRTFLEETKGGKLVVVINNEKDLIDGALVSAVKKYWKQSEVEYLSETEYTQKIRNGSGNFNSNNIYLIKRVYYYAGTAYPYGYSITNRPDKLNTGKNSAFQIYFSDANMVNNTRTDVVQGFFDLMVKNFNHELENCKTNIDSYIAKPKKFVKKGGYIYFKEDNAFDDKVILLTKNQVLRKAKPITKKEKKQAAKDNAENKSAVKVNDKSVKEIVVFDEDLNHAVNKDDEKIIIRNGGTLYSAKDGSIYRTNQEKPRGMGFYYAYSAISLLITIGVLVFVIVAE